MDVNKIYQNMYKYTVRVHFTEETDLLTVSYRFFPNVFNLIFIIE